MKLCDNKKIMSLIATIIAISTILSLTWATIVVPKIDKLIEAKQMTLNGKIDALIIKIDSMHDEEITNQNKNDVKFEKIDGKLDMIFFRLDNKK